MTGQSDVAETADSGAEEAAAEPEAATEHDSDSIEGLRAELAKAQATAAENWDKLLRATAETENVRRRATRDVENARRYGMDRLASELLAVVDSMEMGIVAAKDASPEAMRDGMRATYKLLIGGLERHGVESVDPEGEPFDPQVHEAMSMQPSDSAEPGSVLTVVQKGYNLNGRLLRPARVIVASEPPADDGG